MSHKGVSLIEVLMSLVILGMVMLGFSSMDLFSSRQVTASNKVLKTLNDASYLTEFMAKECAKGVGTRLSPAAQPFALAGDQGIRIWIDYNSNGRRDAAPPDREVAFVYRGTPDFEMRYYSDYSGTPGSYVVISKNAYMIPQFDPVVTGNYLSFQISTCWDPKNTLSPDACGSPNNPVARIHSRIMMPAVSTN